ncbi:MAG: glutathione-disulfide reductase [Acidobacteriota bacterium]|nr:glutathione-disulfide reductase [Acidobacteriota bacterium]
MTDYDYDLFVIGAGSGGVRASRMAAGYGARVAVAEERYFGGTCVNVGCVPKKLLVCASAFADHYREASGFGWSAARPAFDWGQLIANKNREIERLNGIYRGLLDSAGVELFEGRARLVDPHTVEIDAGLSGESRVTADQILIAVGSWPDMPPIPGIAHAISSNEAFYLERLPERAAVVGGGYIGVEFAGIFAGLGSRVTLIYRGPLFLRGFDEEIRTHLVEEMRSRGIDLRFDCQVESIEELPGSGDDSLRLRLDDGDAVDVGEVLYATGRRPLVADLGLETCGVELGEQGEILVDEFSRSNVPNIWAIGDVTDRLNLTPVAIHEAMCLARTLFAEKPTPVDHETVATAVFSQPPLAAVGLTEEEARARYGEVDVYRSRFRPLKLTLTDNQERTLVKLIADRSSGRVLGAHMLGPDAPEIIQGLAVAVKMGATKDNFDAAMAIHPTSAEEFVTLR